MGTMVNAAMIPAGIAKETTYGVKSIDFNAGGKVNPILFSMASPPAVSDSYNKAAVTGSTGFHTQDANFLTLGRRDVSIAFSAHEIPINATQAILSGWFPIYSYSTGIHTMKMETATGAAMDSSYSIFIPYGSACDRVSGCVPQKLDIDFVAGTWSFDYLASIFDNGSTGASNVPTWSTDYNMVPAGGIGGYMRKGVGYLATSSDVQLQTSALTMSISRKITADERTFSGGVLASAVVDGIDITGHYECVTLSQDTANNVANAVMGNRGTNGYGVYNARVYLDATHYVNFKFCAAFKNEKVEYRQGGWVFMADFGVIRNLPSVDGVINVTISDDNDINLSAYL